MIDFKNKPIFGMLHLSGENKSDRAEDELTIYEQEGVDGIIIENYHGSIEDIKKVLRWRDEIESDIKIGINILPNEYELAFAFADVYGLDFIQLDYVSGIYKSPGGKKTIDIYNYDRFRKKYSHITVFGGVWPKYYEPVDNSVLDIDIKLGLERADAIVVTGAGTGKETPLDKIKLFRQHVGNNPLIIGAGLDAGNVAEQLEFADGAIVGSCFKLHKRTQEIVDRNLVREFMDEVKKVRTKNIENEREAESRSKYRQYMKVITDKFIGSLSESNNSGIPTYKELSNGKFEFGQFNSIDFVNEIELEKRIPIVEYSDKQTYERRSIVQLAWEKEKNKMAVEYLQKNTITYEEWLIKSII